MKRQLLKALFVAAGMVMATNAWAQTTNTLLECGTDDVAWSSVDYATLFTQDGGTVSLEDAGLQITGSNATHSLTATISPTANAIINVEAVWYGFSATGRYFSNGNASYFRFGNVAILENDQDQKLAYLLDFTEGIATNSTANCTSFSGGGFRGSNVYYKISAVINTATGVLTSLTVTSEDGATTYLTLTNQTLANADYTEVAFGYVKSGGVSGTTQTEVLKSIKITETTQDVTTYEYSINYTYNGETISSTTGTTADGAEVSAAEYVEVDGVTYLIEADEAPTLTVSEGNTTLDVPVRLPYTATLSVTTTVGEDASSTETTELTEGVGHDCSWSYAYPIYKANSAGVYYKADVTSSFGESGTFTDGETITKTVTYTTADDNIVFFSEGEDTYTTATGDYSYSSGGYGHVAAQNARDRGISVGTLAAGEYEIETYFAQSNRRSLVVRLSTADPIASFSTSSVSTGEAVTATFSITDDDISTNVYINGANYETAKTIQSEEFDYVLIRKIPTTTVTINTNNLASYSDAEIVTVPDDVDIYIATTNGDESVDLVKVDSKVIPANQGVVLYCATAGDITLTYTGTADESLYGDNIFSATGSGTYTVLSSDNCYALVKTTQAFAKVAEGVVIPANKAYINSTSGAKVNFGALSEVTAISSIAVVETASDAIYNLAGQRVDSSYKGVVIKGGKKYIAK